MRKLIPALVLLILAPIVRAQCANNGGVPQRWSCLAGSTVAQFQTAINGSTDGAIITAAAGSYAGGRLLLVPGHGFTIICATPPPSGTINITAWSITSNVVTFTASNNLVAGQPVIVTGFPTSTFLNFPFVVISTGLSSTQFEANLTNTHANGSATESATGELVGAAITNPCTITSTGTVFGSASDPVSGTNTHLYRFSGFQITGNVAGHSPFNFCDQAGCNGTLTQLRIDHNTCACADGTAFAFGTNGTSGSYWGVIDHNAINSPGNAMIAEFVSQTQPTPPALQLGTISNMFIEDNALIMISMLNPSAGCTDAWGSGAMVVRHNQSLNCLWTTHGTTHNGGPYNYEFYNNSVNMDSGANGHGFENGNRSFHSQGAGTFMAFNNTFQQVPGHPHGGDTIEILHYRDFAYTASGPAAASPSCGTAGVNQWSIDCNLPPCDGTSTTNPVDGNRAPTTTWYGYPCWRQPGRDVATGNLWPMYVWNNKWNDDGSQAAFNLADSSPAGTAPPSCVATSNGTCDYLSKHELFDRDAENAVSNLAQTSSTSPFNGTTGMGFGTLANRPTTCTTFSEAGSGVGYFATDVGAQGTLYRCSATNVWSVQYTPFTYPHPLVGNLPTVATPTFSPAAGGYLTPQTVTITSATGGATICYTNDGTTPTANGAGTCTNGTTLTNGGTVSVTFTQLLKAIGSESGFTDSAIGSAQYTFTTITPGTAFAGIMTSSGQAVMQ